MHYRVNKVLMYLTLVPPSSTPAKRAIVKFAFKKMNKSKIDDSEPKDNCALAPPRPRLITNETTHGYLCACCASIIFS